MGKLQQKSFRANFAGDNLTGLLKPLALPRKKERVLKLLNSLI